jgi:hypothetical protein
MTIPQQHDIFELMRARLHRCRHTHVSGRRCAERQSTTYCKAHEMVTFLPCDECRAMGRAFGIEVD